ncbi:MAG: hypothetical protein HZA20_02515 [Nitrospirae bacterium]|nr:hypothetical protein [Nitrospirota bacterium]
MDDDLASCAPLQLSLYETASYRYIYRGKQEHLLNVEVIAESDHDFVIRESYDSVTKDLQINKYCSEIETRFSNAFHPEALLVLDPSSSNWGQDTLSMIARDNKRIPARTLVDLTCNELRITTAAGTFDVDCIKTAYQENSITRMIVTRYFYRNLDYSPLNGLVKYNVQYADSNQDSSMELTYWNGK